MAFSKAARNGKHGGGAGMGGARWRGRHARHSTAFHAIAVVVLLCFTMFHVELSARRLVDATALDLTCRVGRATTRNMTRYYVRLFYKTKGGQRMTTIVDAADYILNKYGTPDI